jgi:hypothetical protein
MEAGNQGQNASLSRPRCFGLVCVVVPCGGLNLPSDAVYMCLWTLNWIVMFNLANQFRIQKYNREVMSHKAKQILKSVRRTGCEKLVNL